MNYFKWSKDGNIVGVAEVGEGTRNEQAIVDYLMDSGYVVEKISAQEYSDYDEGDEIVLSKT